MKTSHKFTSILVLLILLFTSVPVSHVHATTITVDTAIDENDHSCVDGDCSLRDAIEVAVANDTIDISSSLSGQTVYLQSTLVVGKNLTINGTNVFEVFTLSGDSDNNGTGDVQIMIINSGVTVVLNRLNFSKGYSTLDGGGIDSQGALTITDSTFEDNFAEQFGGGINISGDLTISDTTFVNNSADGGGGIAAAGYMITITNSTFSNNSATLTYGGGISHAVGTLSITNSTFYENYANLFGGGVYKHNGTLNLNNTILAMSTGGFDCYNDGGILGTTSHNLIWNNASDPNNCGIPFLTGDPLLGPLANNGTDGSFTHGLLTGSPAIDAGDNGVCPSYDQRGQSRIIQEAGSACDIGAYERNTTGLVISTDDPAGGGYCTSTHCSLRRAIGGAPDGDTIHFDPALAGQTIHLASTLILSGSVVSTFNLDASDLTSPVIISGDSNDDGTGDLQPFYIDTGATVTMKNLQITKGYSAGNGGGIYNKGLLTLENTIFSDNLAVAAGGGIYNSAYYQGGWHYGTLNVLDSTFLNNTAKDGGAIHNQGTVNVTGSTFYNNTATGAGGAHGGGIFNDNTASVTNSTFSGNYAVYGSGIYTTSGTLLGTLTATNDTFSGNTAAFGSGIYYNTGTFQLKNSILADGGFSSGDCYSETGNPIKTNINNLIEYQLIAHDCGIPLLAVDPLLAPLANNGGPNQTMRLKPGSPAINAGDDTVCAAAVGSPSFGAGGLDQRGVIRPRGAHCDIGAYELKTGKRTFKSQPKYDGWVLESGEFSKIGGTKNNIGKILQVGDNIADKQFRVILSFGTSGLPDNAVITKVIVKVKKAGVVGTNPINTHNNLVVDIKRNKFFTLPALQANDFQAKPGKFKAGVFSKTLYSGWHRAVLFKGAHAYINKMGRTQLRIRFLLDDNDDNIADILKLFSGNAILANRPQLIVEYYLP